MVTSLSTAISNGDASITLTATWTATATYTVTFDTQGGSSIPSLTNVTWGTKISAPNPKPSRSGYTFGGWYKESACQNAWNFAIDTVTANVTLYVKWSLAPIDGADVLELEEYNPYYMVDDCMWFFYIPTQSGLYELIVDSRGSDRISLLAYDASGSVMILLYEFDSGEDIQETVELVAGVYYLIKVEMDEVMFFIVLTFIE